MAVMDPEIETLSDTLITEIVKVAGLPETTAFQRLFKRLFHRATERLAEVGVTTDRLLTQAGLQTAAKWMLSHWCRQVRVRGEENIPCEGPVVVVSNHAGTYDSILLSSVVGRDDLKIVSNRIPFLTRLPHIAEHLIFLTNDTANRMAGALATIRQLKKGGSVLIFGSGKLDPDPDVYPNATKRIEEWSASLELFLQAAPQSRLVVAIVSGMLSKRWAYHPITWLKRLDWQKRRVAIFGQVIQQLFAPGSFYLNPRVSFSPPITLEGLKRESKSEEILPAIIERGKWMLADHLEWEKTIGAD